MAINNISANDKGSMGEPRRAGIWMLREFAQGQSFLFAVKMTVEEDGPDLFAATVAGMEDQMAAMGRTVDEAVQNARFLFMATVDDAIAKGISIEFATENQPITLNISLKDAPKFFHLLESKLAELESQDNWLRLPQQPVLQEQHTD